MSVFRHASVWALRALALWGAIEAGAALYGQGAAQLSAWGQISGHDQAVARLNARTEVAEQTSAAMEHALAEATAQAWPLARPADAGPALRELLIAAGAQAPVVDAEATSLPAPDLARVRLTARWREADANAPQALAQLAAGAPGLQLVRLTLARQDAGGLIEADAELVAIVRATEPAP